MKFGEHEQHGKDGKHQPDDLKRNFYSEHSIYESKHSIYHSKHQMTQNTIFMAYMVTVEKS